MNLAAEGVSVAVLLMLVLVVVRRAVVTDFRTARRAGLSSTRPDRRRPSGRWLLLAHVALGLFVVTLALYLYLYLAVAVAVVAGSGAAGARLAIAWAQVASLAAAAACWVLSRAARRWERRADRRWAAELGERGA